ncbi:pickpocket protein 28-like isoform X2 [Stomoxys calcitrans]|uniref:pickpocket protein 28-like isoform X2 n=1 Tax=Stomoxys calcitrans TaxID=35570 RepID=UPI0027E29846|nr:pickpocket protein 28-like isoform X2 [Stomoxys calcitrans]
MDLNENVINAIQSVPLKENPNAKGRNVLNRMGNLSAFRVIKQIYYEYCANTSIHGIQYLGETRPLKEKLFWICVFIASICCCSNLIQNIYVKWTETPVIVTFAEKSTPVWNIPFPAITICSETKRPMQRKGPSYMELLNEWKSNIAEGKAFNPNINSTEFQEFLTLLHICNTQVIDEGLTRLSHQTIDYVGILNKMLPDFERYYLFCKWFGHFSECDELFVKTYTEEGICYTFNGLNATDIYRENTIQHRQMGLESTVKYNAFVNRSLEWSLENGYSHQTGLNTYPARVLSAGSRAGLFIVLQNFKQDLDFGCRGPIQGYKVLLHSPDDVPLVSKQFVRIPIAREVLIAVKPNMITTSVGISEYNPHRRQCFLSSERSLRFFKIYSQNNCELECLTNYTLKTCGCVKFSMPRTADMPVCGEDKIHCYDRAEDGLLFKEFSEGIKNTDFNFRGDTECNCMSACTSLSYNAEISQGNFDLEHMLEAVGDSDYLQKYPGAEMSRLSIYFKENQFITSKRSELYGVTDFLANCGGIFGLFMGFSILSVVELLYHVSLRLWSHVTATNQN